MFGTAFVIKLNPAGLGPVYSGFLGYYENVLGQAIAVDANQIAYVTGQVGPNFTRPSSLRRPMYPAATFPDHGNAFQPTFGGGATDAFVTKISATAKTIEYSSYLGGSDEEIGYGIAVDSKRECLCDGTHLFHRIFHL